MVEPRYGLVVDDNELVRRFLAEVLRRQGINVVEAASAVQALVVAQATRPAFVVTDIEMPGLNGIELCRQLRNDAVTADAAIVVVSGAGVGQLDAAIAAGCDVVLPKPCPPALLVETIGVLLDNPTGRTESMPAGTSFAVRYRTLQEQIGAMRTDLRDTLDRIETLRGAALAIESKLSVAERQYAALDDEPHNT
jgi:CheY-like chemotaxis protein